MAQQRRNRSTRSNSGFMDVLVQRVLFRHAPAGFQLRSRQRRQWRPHLRGRVGAAAHRERIPSWTQCGPCQSSFV